MPYQRLKVYRCPTCRAPVAMAANKPGGICPKCGEAVLRDDVQPLPARPGAPVFRMVLILLVLAAIGGMVIYILPQAAQTGYGWIGYLVAQVGVNVGAEPGLDVKGQPRTTNAMPRHFSLWELHANDSVRLVEVETSRDAAGTQVLLSGPAMEFDDQVLSLNPIGGQLVGSDIAGDVYNGASYLSPLYAIQTTGNQFGYDLRASHLPHLHVNGMVRLISIGLDPTSHAQKIVAVAIPVEARLVSIYDYKPYRHIVQSKWDVFYYDVSRITGHVSIHIAYRPAGDLPPLNWGTIDALR